MENLYGEETRGTSDERSDIEAVQGSEIIIIASSALLELEASLPGLRWGPDSENNKRDEWIAELVSLGGRYILQLQADIVRGSDPRSSPDEESGDGHVRAVDTDATTMRYIVSNAANNDRLRRMDDAHDVATEAGVIEDGRFPAQNQAAQSEDIIQDTTERMMSWRGVNRGVDEAWSAEGRIVPVSDDADSRTMLGSINDRLDSLFFQIASVRGSVGGSAQMTTASSGHNGGISSNSATSDTAGPSPAGSGSLSLNPITQNPIQYWRQQVSSLRRSKAELETEVGLMWQLIDLQKVELEQLTDRTRDQTLRLGQMMGEVEALDGMDWRELSQLESVLNDSQSAVRRRKDSLLEGMERTWAKQNKTCVVCMSEFPDTVLLPCGHACLCHKHCEELLRMSDGEQQTCPVCRTPIVSYFRIFL